MYSHLVSKKLVASYSTRETSSTAVDGANLLSQFILKGGKPFDRLNSIAISAIQASKDHKSGKTQYFANPEAPEGLFKNNSLASYLSNQPGAAPFHEQPGVSGTSKANSLASHEAANGGVPYHMGKGVPKQSSHALNGKAGFESRNGGLPFSKNPDAKGIVKDRAAAFDEYVSAKEGEGWRMGVYDIAKDTSVILSLTDGIKFRRDDEESHNYFHPIGKDGLERMMRGIQCTSYGYVYSAITPPTHQETIALIDEVYPFSSSSSSADNIDDPNEQQQMIAFEPAQASSTFLSSAVSTLTTVPAPAPWHFVEGKETLPVSLVGEDGNVLMGVLSGGSITPIGYKLIRQFLADPKVQRMIARETPLYALLVKDRVPFLSSNTSTLKDNMLTIPGAEKLDRKKCGKVLENARNSLIHASAPIDGLFTVL